MEPRSRPEPFDSPDHFFQIKWDGVRILAFKETGRLRLQNRRGRERTAQYPELQELQELAGVKELLLDGEVVVLGETGQPSFPRVIRRDFCTRPASIEQLSRELPCTYCVFDLLYLDGEDLSPRPLSERQKLLEQILGASPAVVITPNFSAGVALYRQVERRGLEGVVAKEKESPYLWGIKSERWLKVKPRREILCAVGGVVEKGGQVGALLLGAFRGEEFLYLGRAGSGLTARDAGLLRDLARTGAVPVPSFVNPPRDPGCCWLEPRLTVLVQYAEWTADLRLRAPVVAGFTTRPAAEAVL